MVIVSVDKLCFLFKFVIMKINYSVIFLGITLLSIFSCSDSNEKQKNDLEKENLKGGVLFILESELREGDDSPTKRYIEYNQFGYTVNDYLEYESPAHLFQFFYDENRLLKCVEQQRIERIDFEQISLYLYDEQNRLLKKQITNKRSQGESDGNYDVLYSYENDRIKKESTIDNGKEIGSFEFYYSKNLDSTIQKDIIKLAKDESTRFEIVTFNEDGQKTGLKSYWVDNGIIWNYWISELSYDDNGNEIKNIATHDEEVPIIYEMKYEYDSHGNWTKCIREGDGYKIWTKTRKIYYSNDDISTVHNEVENKISNFISRNNQNQKKGNLEKNNESKSNNNYQQPERQKQLITCAKCQGRGDIVCRECNGTTLMFCGTCSGRGTHNSGNGVETCYYCKGALKVKCTRCNGKGVEGRCSRCNGKGQVQE